MRSKLTAVLAALLVSIAFDQGHAAPLESGFDLGRIHPESRLVSPIDDDVRLTLAGNRHPLAVPANDMGKADDAVRFDHMILSLKSDPDQSAAIENYLASGHDGHWLTPKEFGDHFGVAATDIDRISQWLTGHGFTIDEIPPGNRSIVFSGTVAQVRESFHTEIHRYSIGGHQHLANASEPQIPAALASLVDGVVALHDFRSKPQHIKQQIVTSYTSGSTHYLSPADFRTIYDSKPLQDSGITGTGRSIAILGRSNVVLSDIQQFRSAMGLSANPPQVIINGADPGLISGDEGESDLDLEWAGAVASNATIKFITTASTASTDGIDLSAQYAVNNNVADVISLSYGQCEASMGSAAVSYYDSLWQQAAAQGMTVLVSAGDSGAAGCDSASSTRATHGKGVNGLCTSPYSTCVGGTQFSDTANPSLYWAASNGAGMESALGYIPEVVWNESGSNGGSGLWASGGGASLSFAKPSWQTTPGVPADGKRDVPDVSLTAATHDGYLVYSSDNATQTQTLYVFGGTSASAPSFAGLIALVDQKTGYRQGNVNPTLYGLASRQASSGTPAIFHQITSGNNTVPGVTGFSASTATPAYNQATGLGSVDAGVLVGHWTDLLPATSTSLTALPNPSQSGQNVTFTAMVTGSSPGGTVSFADGAASLGSPVTLVNGVATLVTGSLAAGSHSITASYSGDPNNQPSTSSALSQSVQAVSSVSVSATPSSITAGGTVVFAATVTGSSPSGTVQFKDGGVNLGGAIALSGAQASLSVNLLTAGNHSITAQYSGDAGNGASISAALIEPVAQASSSVSLTASAYSITAGQSVTLTATVNGASPSGSVQFKDGAASLGPAITLSNGTASFSTSSLTVGNHGITANFAGDANNLASTSSAIILAVSVAGDANVPTLPRWAALLLGSILLIRIGWRGFGGFMGHSNPIKNGAVIKTSY
jgi:subtilase family serine protease